ncbi:hypothetical protein L1987_80221 [Smallanthus sonchifolius]|uniref:Uncharacterized protein n=1 Tax=Smallanthus sonchifolius TaxID=185202 RepID=A0ACB8YLD5_9ASTR|nr:hypothetical protein L1987_80221 [Smallanthus sonchifolius]
MPGNGVGDRVHNFFAQENLPQGLRSQDGNWPINDNLWLGNQKQFAVSDSSSRNYNSQQSETERGHGGQRVPDPHIFNTTQTNPGPEFARNLSHPHHEQPSSNGYMYGRQNFQTRPDETNFMGVNAEYGQNNVNQRGFPFFEAHEEPAPEQPSKNLFRPESSEAHGSFDLFGGQRQTNSQYSGLLQQPLQQQQSGFGDIQQLQQQLMLRKMQELQRQQNSSNQASQFARQQASGSHSRGLVNGTPTSDSSGYGWTEPAEVNPNWLHRASPSMHPEPQPQRSMGFVQQQVEPSLYGVPVSSSRGSINQFPHNNSLPSNNYAVIPEQNMVSGKGLFGNTFGQGSNSGMKMEHIQQQTGLQNPSVQESPAEMMQDKSAADAAPLDPEEEKILFGSDDNIWKSFGSSKNVTGGMSSLLDDNEFSSGLPSMQSGSWSALMQSAVSETTSGDGGGGVGVQEEWPDLNFQNPGKHPYKDTDKHQTQPSLSDVSLPNMNDKHHSNMAFQHSLGGNNWLHRGGLQKANVEECQLYESSVPGQRTPQQHGTRQPNNKRNQFNANEPVPPSVNTGFNMNDNDNSLQQSQNNDWKRVNTAAIPNLSNLQQGGDRSNQFSPNNHHINYWKHVDSSVKSKGSENSEISQHRLNNKGPQRSESSFNSSDKEDLNSSRKENSNDSYRSSSSHLPNTVGQREKFSSDAGDSRSLAGTKQSLSNQAGRKISGPGPGSRKFQYHPMGNLDEDVGVPYGTSQGTNTKVVPLQYSRGLGGQDHASFGLTKTSGQGFVPEVEGALKGADDMRFKGMIPGHVANIFAPHDRSVGLSTSDKASQPSQSQNMLELLHKVDQSRDGGIARHLNSLERNLSSEIPEPENSDGSFGVHQRSQSSNSQGIGLQLGPPSQWLPMAMQAVKQNSSSQSQSSANSRGKGHAELSPFPPFQEASCGEFKNDRMSISGQSESRTAGHKMMTNLPAALGGIDFPNARNQLQNHPTAANESFNGHVPQIRQADERMQVGEKLPVSHPRANSGVSQHGAFPKMLPNAWSNIQSQLFSATQAHKSQLNIVESTSLDKQNLEEQEAEKKGNRSSLSAQEVITSVGEQSTEKVDQVQMMNGPAASNDSINTASQKDREAFGRSLKPNSFHQQISLLNQMKAYKHIDSDPNNRVMKRLKDSDNLLHGQQVTVPLVNSEIPRSTVPSDNVDRSLASQPANPPSKDALASGQSQTGPTSVSIENSQISPQMAPSWFDQYGTFKGGQMLSQRADAVRTLGQPFKVSGSLETTHDVKEPPASGAADNSQGGIIWKTPSVPSSVVVDHQLTSPPLKTGTTIQNLVTVRPKKRKWSRDDIHSWLKEVSGSSKNVQDICTASMEWCEATKRLMEKVNDDGELNEDVPKPKRRIILSTQLMQQLFPPPPTTLLLTDATSNYENMAFYAARLALGDACNLVSCVSHSESNPLPDKCRESERIDGKRLSEAVEDCMSKVKRVENDFSRLDKRSSILDLRVECQDVEKFSIINRFAKFHGRGQADGEASSSDTVTNAPKPFPQRYVIAVQLPKNLPERVQCLSL